MRNSTIEDVERVKKGEFVPNVMFTTHSGVLIHMKECLIEEIFNLWEGQKIFETACGKLYLCHTSNLLPIKKHSFYSGRPKKIKHVKGSRKYVKVAYNLEKAIEVCKKQGYVTLVCGGEKLKRFADVIDEVWRSEDGSFGCPFNTGRNSYESMYEYMYIPIETSKEHQSATRDTGPKSDAQFVEDAKLGEVMRKAGWKINDGKVPDVGVNLVMHKSGSTLWYSLMGSQCTRLDKPFGDNIIAYRVE